MKKLFILFLLISLVPFTVGCWNDDDDDQVATTNVLLNQALPAANFAAANAIQDITKLTYEIKVGTTTYIFYYFSHKVVGTTVVVTFYKPVETSSVSTFVSALSGKTADVTVKFSGTTIATKTNQTLPTMTSTEATSTSGKTIDTVAIVTTDVTIPTTGTGIVSTYAVSNVQYNGTNLSQTSSPATNVNSTTPTFTVNFTLGAGEVLPTDLSTVTFSVTVTHEGTKKSYTLTSSDGLTITRASDSSVTIAVKSTNSLNEVLVVNSTYSVAITKTSMTINSKYLALPGAFYFTVTQ